MDVSIAVSLIRGQMGTVVERAVNGAVETVLAEMLRIVGVKFEELKAQVAALQRDKAAVQREKSLKEKENDKIRAMLRYTELKLKYYRQGVEEEIQQRATTSSHPSSQHASPSSTARGPEPAPGDTGPGPGLLGRTGPENSQVNHASQSGSRPMVSVSHQSDEGSEVTELTHQTDQSDVLPDGLLGYGGCGQEQGSEDLHVPGDGSVHEKEEEEDGDWIINLQSGLDSVDPSPGHAPFPADSSTLPCSTPPVQVKEECLTIQEVLSIKEEPEEEQVGTLLLDCQGRPAHLLGPEGEQSEFSGGSTMQRNLSGHMVHGFNFPASTSYNDNNLVVSGFSAEAEMFLASEQKFGDNQSVSEDPDLGMGENLRPVSLKSDQGRVPSLEDPLKGSLSTTAETTQDRVKTQYQTSIHERKNFCLVCGKPQVKLARHLKVHKGHPDIAPVLGLKPSCQKRKVLLEQLRNRGNFLHNSRVVAGGAGLLKVKRRPKEGRTRSYGCCQFCHGSFVSTDLWRHLMRCPYSAAGSSLPALLASAPPRQAGRPWPKDLRPWPKDLRLYEEYKLRRNELQRRSINRRREREKSLPQPLLADLVRERREKTRLRVARWRAKRKLQAGLNQAQALGDIAPGFSQQNVRNLHPQPHPGRPSGGVVPSIRAVPSQATSFLHSNMMPGNNNMMPSNSSMPSNMLPSNNMLSSNSSMPSNMLASNNMLPSNRFPAYISSSSSVFVGRGNPNAQHAVTSTSPHVTASQSQPLSSLMDSHLFH